ncbi:MAG: Hpt domain-containing protein [Balneolaceae bacterium]|nr:Hpt domain-containing protein [Balneolaceae bacterium]MCH8547567.1 Hpt domain-containing protein [Balneolaceae bacterium]
MNYDTPLIDVKIIREMLYNDENYVKEFANASLQSFSEFKEGFNKSVNQRELDDLRRAGHKIKPVATMLHLDPLLEMYETSKTLLEENAEQKELQEITSEMDAYCSQVLSEFEEISKE